MTPSSFDGLCLPSAQPSLLAGASGAGSAGIFLSLWSLVRPDDDQSRSPDDHR